MPRGRQFAAHWAGDGYPSARHCHGIEFTCRGIVHDSFNDSCEDTVLALRMEAGMIDHTLLAANEVPIVVEPQPPVLTTTHGDVDEDAAALYLSYRMRQPVTPRRLRLWRNKRRGPVYHKADGGRDVWYRLADLDEWLEIACAIDPLAA